MRIAPRDSLPTLVAALALCFRVSAVLAAPPPPTLAEAETLYVRGDFPAAERAFAAMRPAKGDTLLTLKRASLQLLRNDMAAARATVAPLLGLAHPPRSAKVIAAESYARELDYAHAAPLERALGREAVARQMESFGKTVPFRYEGPDRAVIPFVQTDPLPVIEVRLDGRGPYFFLIDTGGSDLLVDPVLADSLACPRFGEEEGTFGGGRKRAVAKSRVGAVALGPATFHDVPASLLDCSKFSAVAGGRRISGIVGTLLLMRARATLDYPHDALVLERSRVPAARMAPDSQRRLLPMWLGGDHYVLARGRLNDGREGLWFVDTGLAGASLTAPANTLRDAAIELPDTTGGETGVGGGGSMKVQMFGVRRFQLGGASSNGLIGIYGAFPPALEHALGYRIAGIISHAFLRSWSVTFDFRTMQLILEPPSKNAAG